MSEPVEVIRSQAVSEPPAEPEKTEESEEQPNQGDLTASLLESETSEEAPAEEAAPSDDAEETTEETAEKVVEAAGFSVEQLEAEWEEHGGFTPETVDSLSKTLAGFLPGSDDDEGKLAEARALVDSHVQGIAAQRELAKYQAREVHQSVGGEDQFNAMLAWAETSLGEAEVAELNKQHAAAKTVDDYVAYAGALKGHYDKAMGVSPKTTVNGGRGPITSVPPFKSRAELLEAQADPRYAKDPAFRAKVAERLAVSDRGSYNPTV